MSPEPVEVSLPQRYRQRPRFRKLSRSVDSVVDHAPDVSVRLPTLQTGEPLFLDFGRVRLEGARDSSRRRATCTDVEGDTLRLPVIERSAVSYPTFSQAMPIPSRPMEGMPQAPSTPEEGPLFGWLLSTTDLGTSSDGAGGLTAPRAFSNYSMNHSGCFRSQVDKFSQLNKSSPAVLSRNGGSLPAQLQKGSLPSLSKTPPVLRSDCRAAALQYRDDIATRKAPRRYDLENLRYALLHGDIRV